MGSAAPNWARHDRPANLLTPSFACLRLFAPRLTSLFATPQYSTNRNYYFLASTTHPRHGCIVIYRLGLYSRTVTVFSDVISHLTQYFSGWIQQSVDCVSLYGRQFLMLLYLCWTRYNAESRLLQNSNMKLTVDNVSRKPMCMIIVHLVVSRRARPRLFKAHVLCAYFISEAAVSMQSSYDKFA